jgi:hypothetical protein
MKWLAIGGPTARWTCNPALIERWGLTRALAGITFATWRPVRKTGMGPGTCLPPAAASGCHKEFALRAEPMKRHSEEEFLRWANRNGLVLDPRYPRSAVLVFDPPVDQARFWEVPSEPARRPQFIASLLDLAGADSYCCWRHLGRWPQGADLGSLNDRIEHQILSGIGLAVGSADIVEFCRGEIDRLITLLFSTTIFGWSVGGDLYVVPDHARQILQTDHHGVVHVSCRSGADMERFIAGMKADGFDLPDELPDGTFKMPKWMKGK